jgi:hypothetical protein
MRSLTLFGVFIMADELEKSEGQDEPKQTEVKDEPKGLTQEQIKANAEARMDVVFGDEPIPEELPPKDKSTPEPEPESEPESDPQKKEPEPEPEFEPEPEPADKSKGKEEPKAEDEPNWTAAELRAATHQGWTKEELDALHEKDPDLAKRTCAKFVETVNATSKLFSKYGRLAKPVEQPAQPKPAEAKPESKLKKIDLEKIKKEYEGDPIVDVLEAVISNNETLATKLESQPGVTTHMIDSAEEVRRAADAEKEIAVSQQIELFFQAPDVVAMSDFYGKISKDSKDWNDLTMRQMQNRWKVIEEANLIIKGAASQGMEMPLEEALERAHLLTTADVREQAVRNKIKSQATKRTKSLTLEPSSATTTKPTVKTMAQAETNAAAKLQKVFK